MATENRIIRLRMDTASNWTTNNPQIAPGEVCLIQGSKQFRANNTTSNQPFSSCEVYDGTAGSTVTANDGKTTLATSTGATIGEWSANQSSSNRITLPNFLLNTKVDITAEEITKYIRDGWSSGTISIPNAAPIDYSINMFKALKLSLEKTAMAEWNMDTFSQCLLNACTEAAELSFRQ